MTLSTEPEHNTRGTPDDPGARGSGDEGHPTSDGSSVTDNNTVRNVAIGLAMVAVVLAGLAFLATRADTSAPDWRGRVLPEAEPIPDLTLADTNGEDFNLISDTPGDVTLLMFGYTNCPDVCPISLGTLNAALEDLGPDVANRVDMVFVTADPQRDTPVRLREYLDGYNADFVGLRGTEEQTVDAQDLANVPRAQLEEPDDDGEYAVGHATQIIAYQSDGQARIVYPFGTRAEDWKLDLPRLLDGEHPSQ
ncbi:MAG: SCO family protein [Microthrixaceae bacterium]